MTPHIKYIDGLKGFCAIFVIIFHYLLAFDAPGYVGWQSGIGQAKQWEYYWASFPFSAITNASYALFLFFTIIAFIPAHIFFYRHDKQWLQKQVIVRYFRFVPYTSLLILASYGIYTQGWYMNSELGSVLQEPWNTAMFSQNLSLGDALWTGFLGFTLQGGSKYISSLWCMHIIFIGSYLTYAILFFLGELRHRFIIYLFLWLALYGAPLYAFFVLGVALADILAHKLITLSVRQQKILFILGLIAAMISEAPWTALPSMPYYPAFLQHTLRGFGISAVLLAVSQWQGMQNFLEHKIFLHCARYCFEYIIVHVLILFSVSAWIFLQIHAHLGYAMACIITSLTAVPLNYVGAVVCGKLLQPLASWLSQKAYTFFMPEK